MLHWNSNPKRQEAGSRRQEAGGRRQDAGGRRQEVGCMCYRTIGIIPEDRFCDIGARHMQGFDTVFIR